jgi:hypothetical protein
MPCAQKALKALLCQKPFLRKRRNPPVLLARRRKPRFFFAKSLIFDARFEQDQFLNEKLKKFREQDYREMSGGYFPHVKNEIRLFDHHKIQDFSSKPFLKTSKIQIFFS